MSKPPASSRRSPGWSKIGFAVALTLIALWLGWLSYLADSGRFYWDDDQKDEMWVWSLFVFCLTKPPFIKFAGVAVLGVLAYAALGIAKCFRRGVERRAFFVISIGGLAASVWLWILIDRNPEIMGEVVALTGTRFRPGGEVDAAAAQQAIDTLMGSFVGWWILLFAEAFGLVSLAARAAGSLAKRTGLFTEATGAERNA